MKKKKKEFVGMVFNFLTFLSLALTSKRIQVCMKFQKKKNSWWTHAHFYFGSSPTQDIFSSGNFRHSCTLSTSVLDESTCSWCLYCNRKNQYKPLLSRGRPPLEGRLTLNSPYCELRSWGHPDPLFSPESEGSI